MLTRIRQTLAPPVFEHDQEKTNAAALLNAILLAAVGNVFFLLFFALFADPILPPNVIIIGLWFPIILGSLVLMRRGRVNLAGHTFLATGWLVLTVTAFISGGVGSINFLANVALILIAGLVYNSRAGLIFMGLAAFSGLILLGAELAGYLPAPIAQTTPLLMWAGVSMIFLAAATLVHLVTRRLRRTLTALAQSEANFRALAANANDAIAILVDDGRLIYSNRRAAEISGYHPDELEGKFLADVLDPDEREQVQGRFRQRLAGGPVPQQYETRLVHKNGSLIPVEVTAASTAWLGRPAVIAVLRDISERKQAETRLDEYRRDLEQVAEEAVQRRHRELVLLNRASQEFSSTLELDGVLHNVLTEMQQLLQITGASFWLILAETGGLVCRQAVGPGSQEVTGWQLAPGQGLAGLAAQSGQIVIVPDTAADTRHYKEVNQRLKLNLRSTLSIPLRIKEEVIGVLNLVDTGVGRFTADDLTLLEPLVASAAIAIENARLHAAVRAELVERKKAEEALRLLNEALEQRVEERTAELRRNEQLFRDLAESLERRVADKTRDLSALYEVTAVASRSLDLQVILDQSLRQVLLALGGQTGFIHIPDNEGGLRRAAGQSGLSGDETGQLERMIIINDLADWVLAHGQPLLIPDITHDRRVREAITGIAGLKTCMAAPIRASGQTLGVLNIFGEKEQFRGEDLALLASIADQVGVSMENARLRQQASQAAVIAERERLARDLHDAVTQSLYSLTLFAEAGVEMVLAQDLDSLQHNLKRIGETAQQALREMRLMVHELRPLDLQREGLVGALHRRLNAVEKRANVNGRLVVQELLELPLPVEEALYRIAQEALNNALKHGAVTAVTIYLRGDGQNQVELEVADNGAGFDLEAARQKGGLGLISMRERAEQLGGSISILSAPGEGTRVIVKVKCC